MAVCQARCTCIDGFIRDENKNCIPEKECDAELGLQALNRVQQLQVVIGTLNITFVEARKSQNVEIMSSGTSVVVLAVIQNVMKTILSFAQEGFMIETFLLASKNYEKPLKEQRVPRCECVKGHVRHPNGYCTPEERCPKPVGKLPLWSFILYSKQTISVIFVCVSSILTLFRRKMSGLRILERMR